MKKFLISALVVLPIFCNAASFDCTKASTVVEETICDDKWLSQMDDELNSLYKEAKQYDVNVPSEQRKWIKKRDDSTTYEILYGEYSDRITELKNVIDLGKSGYVVTEIIEEEKPTTPSKFKNAMKRGDPPKEVVRKPNNTKVLNSIADHLSFIEEHGKLAKNDYGVLSEAYRTDIMTRASNKKYDICAKAQAQITVQGIYMFAQMEGHNVLTRAQFLQDKIFIGRYNQILDRIENSHEEFEKTCR